MAITYILFSVGSKKFYTGSSHDDAVEKRLLMHNQGKVKSTKNGKPWQCICVEKYNLYTDARKRELFLKSGVGRKWVNEMFGKYKYGGVA